MQSAEPFVSKLRQILKNDVYNKLISWSRCDEYLRLNLDSRILKYYFNRMNLTRGYTLEVFKEELLSCGFFPIELLSTEDVLVMKHAYFTRHQSLDEWLMYDYSIKLKREEEALACADVSEGSNEHCIPMSNPEIHRKGTMEDIHRSDRSRSRRKSQVCLKMGQPEEGPKMEEDDDEDSVVCLGAEPKFEKAKSVRMVPMRVDGRRSILSKGTITDFPGDHTHQQKHQEEGGKPINEKASKRKTRKPNSLSKSKSKLREQSAATRVRSQDRLGIWLKQFYSLLSNREFREVISWSSDGGCVEIHDEDRLKKQILGKHLGDKSGYKSFQYFLKAAKFARTSNKDVLSYEHPTLRRGLSLERWLQVASQPKKSAPAEPESSGHTILSAVPLPEKAVKGQPDRAGESELEVHYNRVSSSILQLLKDSLTAFEQSNGLRIKEQLKKSEQEQEQKPSNSTDSFQPAKPENRPPSYGILSKRSLHKLQAPRK